MMEFQPIYRKVAPFTMLDEGRAKVVWDSALLTKDVTGAWAEFGVTGGGISFMLWHLAREMGKTVYAFDSWEGAPEGTLREKWHVLPGDYAETTYEVFKANRSAAGVTNKRFVVKKGSFDEALRSLSDGVMYSFAFVDCDLGKSTTQVIEGLKGHLSPGAVLLFDEYLKIDLRQEQVVNDWAEELGLEVETRFGHPHQGRLTLPDGW